MGSGTYRFGRFVLDVTDRSLVRDGVRVEINPRYLDALVLLVTEQGRLVSKDRFMDEVWRGVPVTDEALTQCIRTLRRQLGDSATRPEFIETVVKHGYRFVAPVEVAGGEVRTANSVDQISSKREQRILSLGGAGTVGALAAGLLGGMVYGFVAAATPLAAGTGAASVVLVIIVLTLIVAALGGAGVAFAVAAAVTYAPERTAWRIAAGMMGGVIVGAVAKMIGLDVFALMFATSPGDITGAPEGAVIGAAVGLGSWLTTRFSLRRSLVLTALGGAASGVVIALMGGRMMAGSLVLFSQHFTGSRLRLEGLGRVFGEDGFGPVTAASTGAIEGLLFAVGVVMAMAWAETQARKAPPTVASDGPVRAKNDSLDRF